MAHKRQTIRSILMQFEKDLITIDEAEILLKQKVRREGFFKGAEVLKNSFQEIYNEIQRRMDNDEGEIFSGKCNIDGDVVIAKLGDGRSGG